MAHHTPGRRFLHRATAPVNYLLIYNNAMIAPDDGARMSADIADLKEGQARLEEGQTRLEEGQTRLERRVDRLEGSVGRLNGAELEREVHANIINIASRQLGLNRVRILQSRIISRSPEFQDTIDDAEEQGLITEDQASHLEQSDVILAARRKSDRTSVHVVAEVSGLIGERDIHRAWDRANTLARINGTLVIPVVIGGNAAPPQQETADQKGVSVIITSRLSA